MPEIKKKVRSNANYKCTQCWKTFTSKRGLRNHCRREHGPNKEEETRTKAELICDICQRRFVVKRSFLAHFRDYHQLAVPRLRNSKVAKALSRN